MEGKGKGVEGKIEEEGEEKVRKVRVRRTNGEKKVA
jgi:hypothetical protein